MSMKFYRYLAFVLLAAIATPHTIAEVFTIAPTGMTDSCNEEFENVANALQPGDELILQEGIYAQGCARKLNINGTAEQPIIIRAAEAASVIITRPNATSATNNNIELSGSYYTLKGIHFQYGSSGVRFRSSNNIVFEDNKISDTLNNALTMNSGATDSHIIRGNEIYNTGLSSGNTEGEGMYIGDHSGGFGANNHLIENNYIHDLRGVGGGGNDGIEIKFRSGGNVVRNNLIHNTTIGQEFPCIFVYGHGAEPNIIENNVVYNCGEAILVTADAVIRNNVILDSSIYGIYLNRQNPAPAIRNVTIVNNTVYGSHPTCARFRVGTAPDITISNNIFDCADSNAVIGSGLDNAQVSNNFVRGALSGASIDDARFFELAASEQPYVSVANRDFRLLQGAALIDAGNSNAPGLGATDHDSNARIVGNAVDVGAFEYSEGQASVAPSVSLSGPETVSQGEVVTLTWTSSDAANCIASGAWSGNKPLQGSEDVGPLTSDSAFILTCDGAGGEGVASFNILVASAPAPTVQFNGPNAVNSGEAFTLTWTSTEASECSASGGWAGSKDLAGSEQIAGIGANSTFNLTCSGEGGSASATWSVTVNAAALPATPSDSSESSGGRVHPVCFIMLLCIATRRRMTKSAQ